MVSVIVPVYNVEKYLHRCIDSILEQTYLDYELILVDDGSTDSSSAICDTYALSHTHIRVIHKENGGLSDARNTGTTAANGSYITYIDSDDYVSPLYLQELVEILNHFHADVSAVGIFPVSENSNTAFPDETTAYSLSSKNALRTMLYQKDLDTSACALLIKAEIAQAHPFPVGKYHEDELTTYKYYASAETVAISRRKLYYYVQRDGSIMHTFGQASLDELDAADNLEWVCSENWPELLPAAQAKKFSDYCQVLLSSNQIEYAYPEQYARICDFLHKSKGQILVDKHARLKNRLAAFSLFFGIWGLRALNQIRLMFHNRK